MENGVQTLNHALRLSLWSEISGKMKTGVGCMLVDRTYQILMVNTTQPVMVCITIHLISGMINHQVFLGCQILSYITVPMNVFLIVDW